MPLSEHVYCVAIAFPAYVTVCFDWESVVPHEYTPQAEQLVKSPPSMFFVYWELQYDKKGRSYGQLMMHSFINTTTCPLMHHFLCRVFQVTQPHYSPDLAPCDFCFFPKLKSPFKGTRFQTIREIQEKYDRAADGNSNKGFCRVFWTAEEMLGELCEVPRCLLWKGLRCYVQCFLCPVSSSINISIFHSTWLDSFWTDLIYGLYTHMCELIHTHINMCVLLCAKNYSKHFENTIHVFFITIWGKYYYFIHFLDKNVKAQTG